MQSPFFRNNTAIVQVIPDNVVNAALALADRHAMPTQPDDDLSRVEKCIAALNILKEHDPLTSAETAAIKVLAGAYLAEKRRRDIELRNASFMQPIETAPRDGTYIILFGPSGYRTTPFRAEICRYDAEYRPNDPWVTHGNDSFRDGGEGPTHWMPLPANINSAAHEATKGTP